ncbi:YcbK family protein [Agrobacterium rosae]
MKIVNGNSAYPTRGCLVAVFLLTLSGCVSAVSEDKNAKATLAPAATATPATAAVATAQAGPNAQTPRGGYVDPAIVSGTPNAASQHTATAAQAQGTQQVYGQTPQISGLSTQPTGISASSLSIYANSAPVAAPVGAVPADSASTGSIPAYAPTQKIVPALNSVYSAPATAPQPAANPVSAQANEQHSARGVSPAVAEPRQAMATQALPTKSTIPADPTGVPIAAFFASAAKKRGSGSASGLTQMAALPISASAQQAAGIALNGRQSMTDEFDDTHVDEDDKPAGLMKLASLSGLSRIAPNGLLLQTEQVNVGCFKPELIKRIKEVETHYGRPATVTSGYRPPKATTQGSKHYTCDAADIQVSGVSKWELANYLRSIPDRGGVGTYCHTESVHMDLGEPRDWNWRCRRTSKSL